MMKKATIITALLVGLNFNLAFSKDALSYSPEVNAKLDKLRSEIKQRRGTVRLIHVIESYSIRYNAKIIVDPRVKGVPDVLGKSLLELNYDEMQKLMAVHGYAVINDGDIIKVFPDITAKQSEIRIVEQGNEYLPAEYVIDIIPLEKSCALYTATALRPLVPQQSYIAQHFDSNSIIIADRYANTVKIRKIIETLEKEMTKKANCPDFNVKCGNKSKGSDKIQQRLKEMGLLKEKGPLKL